MTCAVIRKQISKTEKENILKNLIKLAKEELKK
ncbi:hypothetical protein IX314_001933 [Fusobacterium sp. DD26]|nr:hypothetical protein [Fusobacterium sp. DD45]MBR8711892.1 hypothetical protein [Fusobacterium sp. DD28]MBR8752455.1 hypothetical protein [Fusobacterium sp. DD26]